MRRQGMLGVKRMVGSRVGESISPTSVVSASACALGYGAGGAAVVVVELIISC